MEKVEVQQAKTIKREDWVSDQLEAQQTAIARVDSFINPYLNKTLMCKGDNIEQLNSHNPDELNLNTLLEKYQPEKQQPDKHQPEKPQESASSP